MRAPTCPVCGDAITPRATPGRPRRYCSGRCRTEAYRTRQALELELGEPLEDQPNVDTVVRAELLDVADALIDDSRSAPPEEQLVRAVIETRNLAHSYRRLAPRLPTGLAWRADQAGARIDAVVDDLFNPNKETQQ